MQALRDDQVFSPHFPHLALGHRDGVFQRHLESSGVCEDVDPVIRECPRLIGPGTRHLLGGVTEDHDVRVGSFKQLLEIRVRLEHGVPEFVHEYSTLRTVHLVEVGNPVDHPANLELQRVGFGGVEIRGPGERAAHDSGVGPTQRVSSEQELSVEQSCQPRVVDHDNAHLVGLALREHAADLGSNFCAVWPAREIVTPALAQRVLDFLGRTVRAGIEPQAPVDLTVGQGQQVRDHDGPLEPRAIRRLRQLHQRRLDISQGGEQLPLDVGVLRVVVELLVGRGGVPRVQPRRNLDEEVVVLAAVGSGAEVPLLPHLQFHISPVRFGQGTQLHRFAVL